MLLVGLGNPGEQYARTRHNAGFWLLDRLAADAGGGFRFETRFASEVCRLTLHGHDCWLLKPQTFMNRSGQAVGAFCAYYKLPPAGTLVAHDELDLLPGTARLKRGGGHGGHNGLRDVVAHIGADFLRLRLGIGHPGSADDVTPYVLSRPTADEEAQIESAISDALRVLPFVLADEVQKAMNALHRPTADS